MKFYAFGKLLPAVAISALLTLFSCEKDAKDQAALTANQSTLATEGKGTIGINVLLNTAVTNKILTELGTYGNVLKTVPELNALTMRTTSAKLAVIQKLSFVSAANPDAVRTGAPIDAVPIADFASGFNTWNLDAVNVTSLGTARTVIQDGTGVFVAVLDTGLPDSWRIYFPQERIATQYAKAFGGGGGENGNVSEQPNKWEHDQHTHGGHVTSTIIGFQFHTSSGSASFNGVAPKATIIPVKVLNQNGSGWSSVVANGIVYIANLKAGPLSNSPVVINMSLGGPELDAVEKAAIDYAISKGVIIVASAGNGGEEGMGYPGAYQPVISAANSGWKDQWANSSWWFSTNVPDPTNPLDFYIAPSSSREKDGQDLDVAAPGTYVVGPFQLNSGQISYFYLTGTSMASPHVAGIIALMAQKNPSLNPTEAESILEAVAIPLGEGSRSVRVPDGTFSTITWNANASGHGLITANAALSAIP